MKNFVIIAFAIASVGILSCSKDPGTFNNTGDSLPTLTTDTIKNITNTTATGGGRVLTGGVSYVSARGICWSLVDTPTIDDSKTINGGGIGKFTSEMTGLYSGMNYNVRAYATSPGGTVYGNLVTFKTTGPPSITLPALLTTSSSSITSTSASTGGNITSNGGSPVTARGVVYSTTSGPTIANSHTTDGTGSGVFTSSLTGLTPNTTYYIKAYATNILGTAYGAELSFTTPP